jgi:hypothetical protein
MYNPKLQHPWRRGRSGQFAAYLEALPREERARIEAAERAYVFKADTVSSRQRAAIRKYAESMVGVREELDLA